MTSKPLNTLVWNLINKFFMMPRCTLFPFFAELLLKAAPIKLHLLSLLFLNRLTDWAKIFMINSLCHLNALSLNFFRWCKVLILLSLIYHYIISIYKAIWYQWLFCLFVFCSLTPPKQQTPTRLNFERWFPLGCRGFQAKKHSDYLNHW